MQKFTNPLDGVRVAAPCRADWEKMAGDERMRYCGQCSLHVYNLSGMTRKEAEALVANTEGSLCVRFYRRAEGHCEHPRRRAQGGKAWPAKQSRSRGQSDGVGD